MVRFLIITAVIFLGFLGIYPVLGEDNQIPHDGTVYVGEKDLDISNCMVHPGDEIAWWDSGNTQGIPSARARIDDVRRFTVDPDLFRGHTGAWYGLIGKKLVFYVEEPFLQFDLNENGIDTEPDSIKRGNLVAFKISTNLAGISKRPGSSGVTVMINMTGPNNTVYHSLSSPKTNDFNLDKVYVYTSPYDTGVVWDTSDEKKFPDGNYVFSASLSVNHINETLPESGISYTDDHSYHLGKTEIKPTLKETTKPDKESSKKDSKVSVMNEGSVSPTETPEKKSGTSSDNGSEGKSGNKSVTKKVKEGNLTEKITEKPSPEATESGKKNKTITITPTETEIPTVTDTPLATVVFTEEPTQEPARQAVVHSTRTPYPRPPADETTSAKGSPISPVIIFTGLGLGVLLFVLQKRR